MHDDPFVSCLIALVDWNACRCEFYINPKAIHAFSTSAVLGKMDYGLRITGG